MSIVFASLALVTVFTLGRLGFWRISSFLLPIYRMVIIITSLTCTTTRRAAAAATTAPDRSNMPDDEHVREEIKRRLASTSSSSWSFNRGPEVVEGCFNHFDALAEVPMDPNAIVGFFNNVRCQAACATQGYALAATTSRPPRCLCGNDYPSPFHQVCGVLYSTLLA